MSDCSLDKCQLKEDVAAMESKQQIIHDTTLRMEVGQTALFDKFDEYITKNDDQHKTFYERTRYAVTWKALLFAIAGFIAAIGTITGIIFGAMRLHG
jgi:hypothetical protein